MTNNFVCMHVSKFKESFELKNDAIQDHSKPPRIRQEIKKKRKEFWAQTRNGLTFSIV